MLTVWCVCLGDKYPSDYVYRLKNMVERHLTIPHEFKCVTDRDIDGVDCVPPLTDWPPSWWHKLTLFEMATGPSIYFDLDVVIVDSINYLENYANETLSAPANWGQSGHGGVQSSVMAWSGRWNKPFHVFDYDKDSKRLWGDQEFLTELVGDAFVKIPYVCSYKYHCRARLPEDASVVCFHGKPDYPEVKDGWVREHAYSNSDQFTPKASG